MSAEVEIRKAQKAVSSIELGRDVLIEAFQGLADKYDEAIKEIAVLKKKLEVQEP